MLPDKRKLRKCLEPYREPPKAVLSFFRKNNGEADYAVTESRLKRFSPFFGRTMERQSTQSSEKPSRQKEKAFMRCFTIRRKDWSARRLSIGNLIVSTWFLIRLSNGTKRFCLQKTRSKPFY